MKAKEAEAPSDDIRSLLDDPVFDWRMTTLVRSGYDVEAAFLIAERRDVDLHMAVSLLDDGCEITTALLILL